LTTYELKWMLKVVQETLCLPMVTPAIPCVSEDGEATIFWTGIATNILTAKHFEVRYENVFYFDPEHMDKLYTVCTLQNPYIFCFFDSIIVDSNGIEIEKAKIINELSKLEKVTDMEKAHKLIKLNWMRENEDIT